MAISTIRTEAAVKALRADIGHSSARERLHMVKNIAMPGKHDVIMTFTLKHLARVESLEDLESLVLCLSDCMLQLPIVSVLRALRKADLVQSISRICRTFSQEGKKILTHLEILSVLLLRNRRTMRMLLCPIEVAVEALISLSALHDFSEQFNSISYDYYTFLRYVVSAKSSVNRLVMHFDSIGIGMAFQSQLTGATAAFLTDIYFNTVVFQDASGKEYRKNLLAFHSQFPSSNGSLLVFQAVANARLPPERRQEYFNLILLQFLSTAPQELYLPVFSAYKTAIANSLVRPLSRATELCSLIAQVLSTACSDVRTHENLVLTVLALDIDAVLPKYGTMLFSDIAKYDLSSLEVALFEAFEIIKSVSTFLESIASAAQVRSSMNDMLCQKIAIFIRYSSDNVRSGILKSLLQLSCDRTSRKCEILAAIVTGFPNHSKELLEQFNEVNSVCAAHPDSHILAAAYMCKVKTSNNIQCFSPKKYIGPFELQCNLRKLELGDQLGHNELEMLTASVIEELGHPERQDFKDAFLSRWISALAPLLSTNQQSQLVKRLADFNILHHPNVLELDALHKSIQQYALQCLTPALYQIPIEFYHKGVRQRLVQMLMTQRSPEDEHYLRRHADADSFIQFDTVLALQDFLAGRDHTLTKLYLHHVGPTKRAALSNLLLATLASSEPQLPYVRLLLIVLMEFAKELDSHKFELAQDTCRRQFLHDLSDGDFIELATSLIALAAEDDSRVSFCEIQRIHDQYQDQQGTLSGNEFLTRLRSIAASCDTINQNMAIALLSHNISSYEGLLQLLDDYAVHINASILRKITQVVDNITLAAYICEASTTSLYWQLLTCILQKQDIQQDIIRIAFDRCCSTESSDALTASLEHRARFINEYIIKRARSFPIALFDKLCDAMRSWLTMITDSSTISEACGVLRVMFEHLQGHTYERLHIVVELFREMLRSLYRGDEISAHSAQTITRCFHTFVAALRRHTESTERANKALAKHLPWLLIEYISQSTRNRTSQATIRSIIEEGLCYEIMSICTSHEREMVGAFLDSGRRAVLKRLFDEWSRHGRYDNK